MKHDQFTQAYIEAALFSSTLPPYETCPGCGKIAVLHLWNAKRDHVCIKCGSIGPNYDPPADDNYDISDISEECMATIAADCKDFQDSNEALLQQWYEVGDEDPSRAGHDFWFTRNRHGAGFWDRWSSATEAGKIGQKLTDLAHAYGEVNLYVGDDGKIYCG